MKLKEPMKVCKICFKEIKSNSMLYLMNKNTNICSECFNKFHPVFKEKILNNVKGISIYKWDENISSLLKQIKKDSDIELCSIFLSAYCKEFRLIFSNYILVPIPSWREDDTKRMFNHVVEIFKILKLPISNQLLKTTRYKSSQIIKRNNENISQYIFPLDENLVLNKKVLIVDDFIDTGSTMKACIDQIKQLKPKAINYLVLAAKNSS